jgi:hypothetical protein
MNETRNFPRTRIIVYWVATAFVVGFGLVAGVLDILRIQPLFGITLHLGYPPYFATLLGTWKVLGGLALAAPRFPLVKEWAYAGSFFDYTAAIVSYVAIGEGTLLNLIGPILSIICLAASWALRAPSRRIAGRSGGLLGARVYSILKQYGRSVYKSPGTMRPTFYLTALLSGVAVAHPRGVCAQTTPWQPSRWVASLYLGTNFGDVELRRGGIGASIGYLGRRIGVELDLERYWHFFKDSDLGNTSSFMAEDVDTRATSFMANLVIPSTGGVASRWHPYGVAGIGVIRSEFKRAVTSTNTTQTDPAFSFGGGVVRSLGSRTAFRGDVRYFRALAGTNKALPAGQRGDLSGYYRDFGFVRATVGVTLTFPP